MIYFTHRNFKVKIAKWLTFYFNHVGVGGHFSTLKFDPIFNDLLYLFETDQTAYISFQQVRKGVNFQRWNLTLYNNNLSYTSHFNS